MKYHIIMEHTEVEDFEVEAGNEQEAKDLVMSGDVDPDNYFTTDYHITQVREFVEKGKK